MAFSAHGGWKPSFSIVFLKIGWIIALAELRRNDSTALGSKSAQFGTYGEQNLKLNQGICP
jgi:hypothetical protein